MKKVPPSVRVKEEVERVLRGGAVEEAPAEAPMQGFVRALHVTPSKSPSRRKPQHFSGAGTIVGASECVQDGGTATKRSACKPRPGCWSWRCRKCAQPRNRSGRRWSSGWELGLLIWKGLVRGMYVRGLSTRDVSDLYGRCLARAA